MGIESDISDKPDSNADINHHIIYINFNGKASSIDTLMVTHVDDIEKKNLLKSQLKNGVTGICMSRETMFKLTDLNLPREKLCYINPAHDGVIIPKPKIIGITCRVQYDGRKRETFLNKLAEDISPESFSFKIMGDGWDNQVECLRKNGFTVEYTNRFIYEEYVKLIPSLDYYLYMGHDEGQMGFVDALAAGIETIVTPQGYHLDAENGITYPFNTYQELKNILIGIAQKRDSLVKSVATWNWYDYTKKHLEIWEYLIAKKNNTDYPKPIRNYKDGILSISEFDHSVGDNRNTFYLRATLICELIKHKIYSFKYYACEMSKKHGIKTIIPIMAKKTINTLLSRK
jgi:hypothetical protein